MSRRHACVMFDLVAATESGYGDGRGAAIADGGKESLFTDGAGNSVPDQMRRKVPRGKPSPVTMCARSAGG